jgi:hypothetical protein
VPKPVDPLSDAEGKAVYGQAASPADRPVTGFSGAVGGMVTGRLPRIGDAPETDPAAVTDPALLDLTDRYARAFNNPQGKPVFAIVRADRPGGPRP